MKIKVFWIYLNGKKYCRVTDKEQCNSIVNALNRKQIEKNCFSEIKVIEKEIIV